MKEFCILGKLSTKYYAPFDNENITIISMNAHSDECMIPRVDFWFDLHHNPEKENADYTINNFPFEECHKLMGRRFCTTMSYLIAWCILQGATKISLYGSRFTTFTATFDCRRRDTALTAAFTPASSLS